MTAGEPTRLLLVLLDTLEDKEDKEDDEELLLLGVASSSPQELALTVGLTLDLKAASWILFLRLDLTGFSSSSHSRARLGLLFLPLSGSKTGEVETVKVDFP